MKHEVCVCVCVCVCVWGGGGGGGGGRDCTTNDEGVGRIRISVIEMTIGTDTSHCILGSLYTQERRKAAEGGRERCIPQGAKTTRE